MISTEAETWKIHSFTLSTKKEKRHAAEKLSSLNVQNELRLHHRNVLYTVRRACCERHSINYFGTMQQRYAPKTLEFAKTAQETHI